ncbi:MAG: sulfite exporter TauE/SafE family protein [Chloroflexi bacterium]|nr:sulfite exporter TauE/SafE family protein [Chloroflexota bacterium]
MRRREERDSAVSRIGVGREAVPAVAVALLLGAALAGAAVAGAWDTAALVTEWYTLLNNVYLALGVPLSGLARGSSVPLLSALLLGVVGALSPCQLTTGAAALAYLTPQAGAGRGLAGSLAAYVAGKALVYSLLGGGVLLAGFQMNDAIPLVQVVRKALGPLMLLLGAYFFGWLPLQFTLGQQVSFWLEERFAGDGVRGAFALGLAFSLAFCPTLFLLFFGLLLPLALVGPLGTVYPALFALGTALPLVALAIAVRLGLRSASGTMRHGGRFNLWVQRAAAAVLLLVGLNDTVVYWFV